ncbi:MAG: DUF6259 domain-containing protein [Candidatus Ratteibacteria bacterium]|jgi:hypothetical protein
MKTYRPTPALFTIKEESGEVAVSCQWWETIHSPSLGGTLSSIRFFYGSNENIFTFPCETSISLLRNHKEIKFVAKEGKIEYQQEKKDCVVVETKSRLYSKEGESLPLFYRHRYEYHKWGYIRQRVCFECEKALSDVWEVIIAQMSVVPRLNEFTVRNGPMQDAERKKQAFVIRWYELFGGAKASDQMAFATSQMPLQFTILQRDVEGFDWFISDDIDQWYRQIGGRLNQNHFFIRYSPEIQGYEIRTGALNIHPDTLRLKESLSFDFYMALPFVQEHVSPLRFSVGGLLNYRPDRKGTEFPDNTALDTYQAHGVTLARLHNDGPSLDAIFWRDGLYPPYPPERMEKMDKTLEECHRRGIKVTPYFSLTELHPEAPEFTEHGEEWRRMPDEEAGFLYNHAKLGMFGAQMCLVSRWREFLKKSIDRVLKNHAFDGVYYDWCNPMPCVHPAHQKGLHWSVEEFIEFLEWTRERVGTEGEIYLHMTYTPFVIAENIATRMLVFETPTTKITPEMFSPDVSYMKLSPRGVCSLGLAHQEPKRFALCCLLQHVAPEVNAPEALEIFRIALKNDFTRYTNFSGYNTPAVTPSRPEIEAAIYWNHEEALLLLVNLSEEEQETSFQIHSHYLGWEKSEVSIEQEMPTRLNALSFLYLPLKRHP